MACVCTLCLKKRYWCCAL